MSFYKVSGCVFVGFLAGSVNAEVLTGQYENHIIDYLLAGQGGPLAVSAANAQFDVNGEGHNNQAQTVIRSDFVGGVSILLSDLRTSPWDRYFREGESLMGYESMSNQVSLGGLVFDNGGDVFNDLVGEIGEHIFMGYSIANNDSTTNLGFIQFTRIGEFSFEAVGWAYESSVNTDLIAFNIVPAPSGIAIFGLAGLGMTRRRRG